MNEDPKDSSPRAEVPNLTPADAQLVQQLRQGDREAKHQFVREFYPGVYRYLLYLTERREMAEDLTQETFLQAWRRLDTFQGRAPLRLWLHRIAHREFLQAVRSDRSHSSLEEVAETAARGDDDWTETIELRDAIRKLPADEREVVILHYLQGYSCEEIAEIVRVHVSSIKYRLSVARSVLQRELGEGDFFYLNEPSVPMRPWMWLPLEEMSTLEARLAMGSIEQRTRPPVRAVPCEEREGEQMERREFLRRSAVGAAGLMLADKEVLDSRLTKKVSLAVKGMALSDLCERLRADTGVHLVAGNSVADEKVTLFCEKLPLREVMRQLSRPFGYTWLRSGKLGEYCYELVQDLKSQLLEEELRNRDRNAALLALDREMEAYRKFLPLSPDEALARARTASPEEKQRLENLARYGWGPTQIYFRLGPRDLAALRSGETLTFSADPQPGELPLPPDVARGVLQSLRDARIESRAGRFRVGNEKEIPDGLAPTSVPEAHGFVTLRIDHRELGLFELAGGSGIRIVTPTQSTAPSTSIGVATGRSSSPGNRERAGTRLAADPSLRRRVSVRPEPSCEEARCPAPNAAPGNPRGAETADPAATSDVQRATGATRKVTSADALEALHRATDMPIVADYYTHLYPLSAVRAQDQPLFEALNQLADAMRLRWNKEGSWLQFRSATYYDDRLKEVPNRLLARWSAARLKHGTLSPDDLIEIAQLSDPQLDSKIIAEGVKECFGLTEWDLAHNSDFRPHLRYLAAFTPAQRQEAMSPAGLPFTRMSLAQQQQFIARLGSQLQSVQELATALLRVEYTQPGWFQWESPEVATLSPVRERKPELALQAARRIDSQADAAQIVPTERAITVLYTWGTPRQGGALLKRVTPLYSRTRTDSFPPRSGG
jgi:RNA polymerase sigma-70 factor (ECF subfamily)